MNVTWNISLCESFHELVLLQITINKCFGRNIVKHVLVLFQDIDVKELISTIKQLKTSVADLEKRVKKLEDKQ